MQSEICPQCKDAIQGTSKRIVKDSCGHEKCRVCLLEDVESCKQCEENQKKNEMNAKFENPVAVVENIHTTVITCSKSLNSEDLKGRTDVRLKENEEKELDKGATKGKGLIERVKLKTSQKRRYESIIIPSHITVEGSPPVYFCTICKAKFRTKGHVKYHKFCRGESKPHLCSFCDHSFILKSQLNVHELIHLGKKPYICKLCDKSFRESGKLKRHMVQHSDDKPHICDECGKDFKTLNSLRRHRIIHTGEKPYSCKYCKMRFNNSSNLKKHILSHSDDKTHMCEQCGKKFKQKWALTVHRRSHFHKRDFECEICHKAFVNNKDLKRHETVHLDVKIYSCGICSMSFRRKDNLGRHFRNAHPGKDPQIIKRDIEPIETLRTEVVDNPNAINVITPSPLMNKNQEINRMPRTCMNGPPKLAFKTSAFKKNYNINRDHAYDSNSREKEKHFEQSSQKSSILHHTVTPDNFPSVYAKPIFTVDEYYANRPHVIKNIKFKIPTNYPPENEGVLKTIMHPLLKDEQKREIEKIEEKEHNDRSNANVSNKNDNESGGFTPTNGVTSVIVNSSDHKNILWGRKI